jgi:hypothetical protein
MRHEGVEKSKLGLLALRPRRAGREIERDHRNFAETRLEIPAFVVELIDPKAADDL